MDTLGQLKSQVIREVEATSSLQDLEEVRVKVLGKKGHLTLLMKDLGQKTPEERKTLGAELNILKETLTQALDQMKAKLEDAEINAKLSQETLDVTLPARPFVKGMIHPLSHVLDQVIHIFGQMGFVVAEGPEIEEDFYNFTALNFP